jgi:hypothetical protein
VQGATQPSEFEVRRRSKKWLARSRSVFGRSGAATASASADMYLKRSCVEADSCEFDSSKDGVVGRPRSQGAEQAPGVSWVELS